MTEVMQTISGKMVSEKPSERRSLWSQNLSGDITKTDQKEYGRNECVRDNCDEIVFYNDKYFMNR
jgi:hypothetical protein